MRPPCLEMKQTASVLAMSSARFGSLAILPDGTLRSVAAKEQIAKTQTYSITLEAEAPSRVIVETGPDEWRYVLLMNTTSGVSPQVSSTVTGTGMPLPQNTQVALEMAPGSKIYLRGGAATATIGIHTSPRPDNVVVALLRELLRRGSPNV